MKFTVASVLASLFLAQAAAAQSEAPPPSPNPVEEQEVDASQADEALPEEGTGEAVEAAPAVAQPGMDAGEAAWDVTAPRGAASGPDPHRRRHLDGCRRFP